jgi:hypothetical protein
MCLGTINHKQALAEGISRRDPMEYERRKAEAYIDGSADPAPAVVTFTTEIACAAVNTLIDGLTGFRGENGMAHNRIRRFDSCEDRLTTCMPVSACPVCQDQDHTGRGDIQPFLGVIG